MQEKKCANQVSSACAGFKKLAATATSVFVMFASMPLVCLVDEVGYTDNDTGLKYTLNTEGKTVTVSYCNSMSGDITIPDSIQVKNTECTVTKISDNAFWNHTSLTSITIPSLVTTIEFGAFEGCSSLNPITIPCNFDKEKFNDTSVVLVADNPDKYELIYYGNDGGNFFDGVLDSTFTYTHSLVSGNQQKTI